MINTPSAVQYQQVFFIRHQHLAKFPVGRDGDEAQNIFVTLVQHRMPVWYHAGIMCEDHITQKGDTMVVERLRAVFAAAEKLPENEQEQLVALWEETLLDNTRWHELFQQPGSQAFFAQLHAEAAEAAQSNAVEDSPDEDWA